ncbi:MAG: hypothetical protein WKF70_10190 [Chitinophagaceae bacterium]
MSKYAMVFLAALVFNFAAQAQNKKGFSWNKKYMAEVGLSAEQQVRADSIKTVSNTEMQIVKTDTALSAEARKEKLAQLQRERMVAINALLTNDQRNKADGIKARLKKESGN